MNGSVDADDSRWSWGRVVRFALGVELIVLLALAQVIFAGYRLGVGNQSIQIPFLKHWIDPELYANDPMVKQTLADYPSFFFKLLAVVVARVDLFSAYFWLHVGTAAAVLAAAYGLGRAMFKDRASGVVLMLLMLAGHHRALAGDDLYSLGFTHTWAVFPLALLALMLFYKGWHWAAFALVGIVFNLHALTAGYLLAMFLTWAAFCYRGRGWGWRLGGMVALFVVLALPTLREMAGHRQQFGSEWLQHTRTRSADHSFPFSWWTTGVGDVPRFVLLMGLAAVSLSFAAPARSQRKSLWLAAGVGFLFLVGLVFSEKWPVATVIRAQLFRSSRLLVVLMLAHVAHGIVRGLSLVDWRFWRRDEARGEWRGSSELPAVDDVESQMSNVKSGEGVNWVGGVLEVLLAAATLVCLAVPGFISVAPWLLLAALLVAVGNGRLGTWQAVAGSLALLATLAAWRTIDYDIPGLDASFSLEPLRQGLRGAGGALWVALGLAAVAAVAMRLRVGPRATLCGAVAVGFACAALAVRGHHTLAGAAVVTQQPWVAAQVWAAGNTPKDALFLTPPQQGGFRIHSARSVVCEWRDGTQLYFSAGFAKDWWDKLTAIRPVLYDAGGRNELMRGKTLERMTDQEIVKLAQAYGANYVVLPAGQKRELNEKFSNSAWAIYEPRILDAQDAFIENVAKPNIEKYRKGDARVELADADGRTITAGEFAVQQTRQSFGFGCSIPFFASPAGDPGMDFEPPVVTPKQLQLFKDVFNYSVIPFSAKWQRIEPVEGERHYEDLDKYVDWCVKNGVTMEFHYLSGFTPSWVRYKSAADRKEAWLRHCRETVARYHDRIKYWQITNDGYLTDWASEVFKEVRAKYPDLKLGISDCQKFYTGRSGDETLSDLMTGASEIRDLQSEGAKLDFFSSHGHKPMGVWPDLRNIYVAFDAFAQDYGVKLHISEATLDLGSRYVSPVRPADAWTPELAAEFFEKFYTVAFSHPAVEAINYWDLGPSIERPSARGGFAISGTGQAGLLDPSKGDEPRLLYKKLKELITERWMTRLSGRVTSDGAVAFRGFGGDYEITVKTPDGRTLKGNFSIKEGVENKVQLRLGAGAGSVAKGN